MLGQIAVEWIKNRIVTIGLQYPAFEVIDNKTGRGAAKKLEHPYMRGGEAALILFIDKLHELVPAVRERSDKCIHGAFTAGSPGPEGVLL